MFDYNLYWNNLGVFANRTDLTPEGNFTKWTAIGYDNHSIITNPMFVNPAADDYRLQAGSPAYGLGFQAIPIDQIGN